ncbi:MAG: STAS domain-containing protein [Lachnospiraceae bacterium]|jgi:anti-sigma B factor antagonist|nr:STAS domain-containing protein [Lachnospiraceae bacterium]
MEETKVTITKTIENNKAIVSVEGWLDTNSSPELGREIEALSDIESLILDFDKLEYIASAGLRIIILAYKKLKSMNGEFSIINVSSEVMDVFKLTGFDQNFDIQTK